MNLPDFVMKPLFALAPNEPLKYKNEHILGSALLGAAIPTIVLKAMGHSMKSLVPSMVGGFMLGATTIPLTNKIVALKKLNDIEMAKKELLSHYSAERDSGLHYKGVAEGAGQMKDIIAKRMAGLSKQAGFFSGAAGMAGKTVWGGTKSVGRALFTKANTPGEKIFHTAVKGTALAGVGYGAYQATQAVQARGSENYTRNLRNQILAGSVHPSEANQSDLAAVRKLGMR